MKKSYESQGYEVALQKKDFNFDIQLNQIIFESNSSLRLNKGTVQTYDSFRLGFNSNLYELISIATNIIEWEANLGDADVWTYMMLYPNLKAEKLRQNDDTKVYILTDRDTKFKFQFASRSLTSI